MIKQRTLPKTTLYDSPSNGFIAVVDTSESLGPFWRKTIQAQHWSLDGESILPSATKPPVASSVNIDPWLVLGCVNRFNLLTLLFWGALHQRNIHPAALHISEYMIEYLCVGNVTCKTCRSRFCHSYRLLSKNVISGYSWKLTYLYCNYEDNKLISSSLWITWW